MVRAGILVLTVVAVAVAQPAGPAPADVVRRAIDAHGGLDVLKKYPAGTSKIGGKVAINGTEFPFTGSLAFAVPGKARLEMTIEAFGQKTTLVQLVNGDKVRQTEAGQPSRLDPPVQAELRESAVIQEMSLLYPLLDATKYTLSAEAPGAVDGRPAAVLLVKAKGLKDARLYFDQKTGLLAGMRREGLNPEQKKVDEFTAFSEYKAVGGMMVPMRSRVSHDGKAFLEITVAEYRPLGSIDEKTFAVE
ncbi:hypothetical protein [Urbifossiella limnaea]|uniref:DUF3108 domain-containing protein n=1 Tax=Urbifossiella limnaea TaxID=2528023 RepID=A0A517XXD7_9BACT|nr:hypothetical protein [Urbifossiella limnaea]QDU22189.1 hypothetical protein ETAA1_41650 [Urbifossiella limnaea]